MKKGNILRTLGLVAIGAGVALLVTNRVPTSYALLANIAGVVTGVAIFNMAEFCIKKFAKNQRH